MTFSLNEIEAMGKRAARGAGFDWGLAEEAGKAARWLSARGLPGPDVLAGLLGVRAGTAHRDLAPISVEGVWKAPSGLLCPLTAGAALADRAAEVAAGRAVDFADLAFPLLLAPHAAWCAVAAGRPVVLTWPGTTLTMGPDGGLVIEGEALEARKVTTARCETAEATPALPVLRQRAAVDAETWSRLDGLAHRTYAPATEASRRLGAGAGMVDSD